MANHTEQSKSGVSNTTPLRKRLFQSPPTELPPGWKEYHDRSTDQVYYANKSTGESSWTRPKLSKADKKQLAELKRKKKQSSSPRLKVERTQSNVTKASESPSTVDITYTKQEVEQKRTVSFSSKHEVRTYKVEPVAGERSMKKSPKRSKSGNDSPSKNVKSSKKRSKYTRDTKDMKVTALKNRQQKKLDNTADKAAFTFWKRRDKKSPPPAPTTAEPSVEKSILLAPSSLLGIRNKSLKKKSQEVAVVEKKESDPPVTTTMSKIASLPLPLSNLEDVETVTRSNSSDKEATAPEGGSIEDAPSEPNKSSKVSSAQPTKAASKIASLLKPPNKSPEQIQKEPSEKKSVLSSNKTWPIPSKKSKKGEGVHVDSSKRKIEPDPPAATTTEGSTETKQDPTEKESEGTSSSRGTTVSDKIKALTASLLLGSSEINLEEKKSDVPSEKSPDANDVCTPPRKVKEADNGSPASSTLASSLPFSELIFDKNLEVDSDSVKMEEAKTTPAVEEVVNNTSPSKISIVNSFFKKNRSKEKEDEAAKESTPVAVPEPVEPLVIVTPSKPEVVSVDTTPKKEPAVKKETSDGDTQTTGSSASGIEAEPLESGWVVEDNDDDFGDRNIEIRESRCGDCGCSQQMHDTLLTIGGLIFKVVGKPNDDLRAKMEDAGDFFAEEDSLDGSEY